ncbi:hypothetical protein QBC39DRAFT_152407 [Podospora conica]|nr:hypothetical protein QBC39DRAFT_152407 [Schizothecium conicum]
MSSCRHLPAINTTPCNHLVGTLRRDGRVICPCHTVSPSPDRHGRGIGDSLLRPPRRRRYLASVHHRLGGDLLELLKLEADPPRGQAAATRTVRRLVLPVLVSPGSPHHHHRRTDRCSTGRRSKRAYPPRFLSRRGSTSAAAIPGVIPTSNAVAASVMLQGLVSLFCLGAWTKDAVGFAAFAWLISRMRLCACVWGGSCAASTSPLWPTGYEPRRYHTLRYATLRARRLERECRVDYLSQGSGGRRSPRCAACAVLCTPPHLLRHQCHGCSSRA